MATDYLGQLPQLDGFEPTSGPGKQAWNAFNQWLSKLTPSERQQALQLIPGVLSPDDLSKGMQQTNAAVSSAIGGDPLLGVTPAQAKANPTLLTQPGMGASPSQLGLPGATPSPTPAPGAAATPAAPTPAATGTSTPTTAQLTEQSGLTQQQYIDLMRLWGLTSTKEVDDMIGAYRQSYTVTYALNQNADFVAGPGSLAAPGTAGAPSATPPSSPFAAYQQETTALGTAGVGQSPWTMSLQPQPDYSDKPPGFQKAMAHEVGTPPVSQRLLTPQDVYAAVMYSSGAGGIAQRILKQYEQKYLDATGSAMPADLSKQVQDAISALSPSEQQQWLEESIAKPGGAIAIAALDNVLSTYEQVHPTPTAQQQQVQLTIAQAFQKAFNRAPTAAEMSALGNNPTPQQISDYINTLPMPGYNMSYGQYQAVSANMTSQWQQYFTRNPTPQELMWGVGKTPQQLQDFIDSSPSQIPGVTIGRYGDLTNWIRGTGTSAATTHAFSAGVDDSLVKSLHDQLQSASTGQAHPGSMSP